VCFTLAVQVVSVDINMKKSSGCIIHQLCEGVISQLSFTWSSESLKKEKSDYNIQIQLLQTKKQNKYEKVYLTLRCFY
jgi:hypothetical protein